MSEIQTTPKCKLEDVSFRKMLLYRKVEEAKELFRRTGKMGHINSMELQFALLDLFIKSDMANVLQCDAKRYDEMIRNFNELMKRQLAARKALRYALKGILTFGAGIGIGITMAEHGTESEYYLIVIGTCIAVASIVPALIFENKARIWTEISRTLRELSEADEKNKKSGRNDS